MLSLCIACCSTIVKSNDTYKTNCCNKQICASCLQANPRLRYYSPCLACAGAVQVVASSHRSASKDYSSPLTEQRNRDESTFAIGEDSDDDQAGTGPFEGSSDFQGQSNAVGMVYRPPDCPLQAGENTERGTPAKYWLQRGDTLHGIALRFKIDAREICKLNGLPVSTLSTNPHLLHTRSYIMLRKADKELPVLPLDVEHEERRRKERAAKQFQFVTKEVDWGIAKAYVALADSEEADDDYGMKRKEAGRPRIEVGTAGGAVERYLDDEEWEQEQIQAGFQPRTMPFPFFATKP